MPDELKTLLEWIESISKALVLAVLAVILFLAAPRSDETLRKGLGELEALLKQEKGVNDAIAKVLPAIDKQVCAELKANGKEACAGALTFDEADRKALGLSNATNVGVLVDTLEGHAYRCEPHVEKEVMAGFRVHYSAKDPFSVARIKLLSSLDPDFVAACNASLVAAREAARAEQAVPTKPPEPPHAGPGQPLGNTEAETIEFGGKTITVSSAKDRQLHAIARITQESGAYKDKLNQYQTAVSLLNASTLALLDQSGVLHRSAVTHTAERISQSPAFVVATVEHQDERIPRDIFVIPVPCEPVAVLDRGTRLDLATNARPLSYGSSGALLPSLRILDQWERIRAATPADARRIVQEAIDKEKGHIEVFGLSLHEDLLGAGLPWLLALSIAFQLIHVLRLRDLASREGYAEHIRAAATALPTLPVPTNWLSGVLIYGSALVAIVLVLACHFSGSVSQITGGAATALLSCAGLALSLLPPRGAKVKATAQG